MEDSFVEHVRPNFGPFTQKITCDGILVTHFVSVFYIEGFRDVTVVGLLSSLLVTASFAKTPSGLGNGVARQCDNHS